MAFFSWLKNLFHSSSNFPHQDDEFSSMRHLESMRKSHSLLDIRIPRLNGMRCQSMILAINTEEGFLTLDEPFPSARLDSGDTLHITCRLKNRTAIEFNSKLLRKQSENGGNTYLLELPASIQGDDAAENYRIYVEKENLILEIEIDNEIIQSQIIAIAFESIKFQLIGKYSDVLKETSTYKQCFLRLDDEPIECTLTIQQSFDLSRPLLHTLCTAKLELEQKTDSKKFNAFLAALQRRQRRRELRYT